jgi:hypothetical protein
MSRSKRENRHRLSKDAQVGLAWYSREAWEKLRAIADDRDNSITLSRSGSAERCRRSGTSPRLGGEFLKYPSTWRHTWRGAANEAVDSIAPREPNTSQSG